MPTNIKDADEAIGLLNELNLKNLIDSDCTIASLDVVNLYPSISTDKGIEYIESFLNEYRDKIDFYGLNIRDILDLLKLICDNYEIRFDNDIYLQKHGVPMGARFAPPFAIIFMYELERKILNDIGSTEIEIRLFKRYIDDIVIIYKDLTSECKWHTDNVLSHFNKFSKNIQFTIELPNEDGFIPFLDAQISLTNNKVIFKWYQKKLHSGNILHYESQLPLKTKKNFVINTFRTLFKRNNTLVLLNDSITFMCNQLANNGYPDNFISENLKKAAFSDPNNKGNFSMGTSIKLPYINENIMKEVDGIINNSKIDIKTIQTKANEPKKLSPKISNFSCDSCYECTLYDTPNFCNAHGVIYDIECRLCEQHYIGRTMRPLKTRIKEHLKDWDKDESKNALGEHMKTKHHIAKADNKLIKIDILDFSKDTADNILKEAYLISKNKPGLNRKVEYFEANYLL